MPSPVYISRFLPPSSLPNDASQLDFMEKMRSQATPEMTEDDPSSTNSSYNWMLFCDIDSFVFVILWKSRGLSNYGVEWKEKIAL